MKRLSKNILSLFSADIARRLLGFISVAYLARVLGKEDFGAVNLGFAVLAYSMVLGASGFPILGTKRIAQGESFELIGQIFGSRLITEIIIIVLVTIAVLLTVQDSTLAYLIILFSCSILPQIFFLDWFFQGKETLGIVSAARVTQALVYLLVVIFFVHGSNDLMWVAAGSILGECAAAIIMIIRFRTLYPSIRFALKPSFSLLKHSLPLAVGIIFASFVINYPPIALGIFNDKAGVGIYSAAGKLVYFLMMGDRILFLLLIPASARKQADSPEKLSQMLFDTMKWILIIGLPAAVGGALIADDAISLIFGIEYLTSASIFRILVWYFLLTMLHTVYTSGLIGVGGEKAYGKIMIITAFLYLLFVSMGSIWYGPFGAAFGVVLAEAFSVVFIYNSLSKLIQLETPKNIFRIILSVIFMSIVVVLILPYGSIASVCAGIIVYTFSVFILKAIKWNDVELLIARFG